MPAPESWGDRDRYMRAPKEDGVPPSRALRPEHASEEGGGLAPQQGPAAPEPGLHPEPRDDQGCVEEDMLAGDDASNHASMSALMRPCYAGPARLKFGDRRVTGGCDDRLIPRKLPFGRKHTCRSRMPSSPPPSPRSSFRAPRSRRTRWTRRLAAR